MQQHRGAWGKDIGVDMDIARGGAPQWFLARQIIRPPFMRLSDILQLLSARFKLRSLVIFPYWAVDS